MKKYKKLVLAAMTLALVVGASGNGFAVAASLPASRIVASAGKSDACDGLSQLGGEQCPGQGGTPEKTVGGFINSIVSIIGYIAGAIAIIMIVVSAIRFITSGGDASKAASARTALVYALIGIAVAGLTQVLVHFVLSTSAAAGT